MKQPAATTSGSVLKIPKRHICNVPSIGTYKVCLTLSFIYCYGEFLRVPSWESRLAAPLSDSLNSPRDNRFGVRFP